MVNVGLGIGQWTMGKGLEMFEFTMFSGFNEKVSLVR